MTRARERVQQHPDLHPALRKAIMSALRAIVLHSIGAFASGGRDETRVATSAFDVPAEYQRGMVRQGKLFVYRVPSSRNSRTESFYHPELAAQVWGRARARVLYGPSALGNGTSGALNVPPSTLIGIQGDALFTTALPSWSLPVANGGGDDGKTGRLRLQGYLNGSARSCPMLRGSADPPVRARRCPPPSKHGTPRRLLTPLDTQALPHWKWMIEICLQFSSIVEQVMLAARGRRSGGFRTSGFWPGTWDPRFFSYTGSNQSAPT